MIVRHVLIGSLVQVETFPCWKLQYNIQYSTVQFAMVLI
jgi:hypothetical protein